MRGRKPVPTELKVIRGNPGRRPLPKDEPMPPEGDVKCPSWVKGRARRIWKELAPPLAEMGLLTVLDVPMLADLCVVRAEFIKARADVDKRGIEIEYARYDKKGNEFTVTEDNPSVRIASDANKRAKSMEVEFGMSPSSRTRVKAAPKAKEKSALEQLRDRRQA
jgi:P27 family predicted phage terminase small subunit